MKVHGLNISIALLLFTGSIQVCAQDPDLDKSYQYNPMNKADPFKPMESAIPSLQITSELQNYDLKDLKLVGTLLSTEMSALILTPNSQGIIVKIGDKLGKNNGRIVLIDRNKLIVRQPLNSTSSDDSTVSSKRQKFEDIPMMLEGPKRPTDGVIENPNSNSLSNFKTTSDLPLTKNELAPTQNTDK